MAISNINPNMFSPKVDKIKPHLPPIKSGKTGGKSKATLGMNPFSPQGKTEMGVGLVNSNLQGLSYALPNGKMSQCNTIGIA